jgi:hypothetical protein
MLKKSLAVIAGILSGGIIISLVESLGKFVHPVPENFDFNNKKALAEFVSNAPPMAFAIIILAWACGAFVAGLVSEAIGKGPGAVLSVVAGSILMLGGLINLIMLPGHPVWFWVIGLGVYIPSAFLGNKTAIAFFSKKQ